MKVALEQSSSFHCKHHKQEDLHLPAQHCCESALCDWSQQHRSQPPHTLCCQQLCMLSLAADNTALSEETFLCTSAIGRYVLSHCICLAAAAALEAGVARAAAMSFTSVTKCITSYRKRPTKVRWRESASTLKTVCKRGTACSQHISLERGTETNQAAYNNMHDDACLPWQKVSNMRSNMQSNRGMTVTGQSTKHVLYTACLLLLSMWEDVCNTERLSADLVPPPS